MILLDLDGPILDVSDRYYRLYSDTLAALGYPILDKANYWSLKRDKVTESEILALSNARRSLKEYRDLRLKQIETVQYLKYDALQKNVHGVLSFLSNNFSLYMVTLRRLRASLMWELDFFHIRQYFKDVLSSYDEEIPKWKIKWSLINDYFGEKFEENSIIVGDTETDIRAGQELGFRTIAVLSGIRNEIKITDANPDMIVDGIWSLPQVILPKTKLL